MGRKVGRFLKNLMLLRFFFGYFVGYVFVFFLEYLCGLLLYRVEINIVIMIL